MSDAEADVEGELFLIRDSGEMPEVGLHASLYWLEKDKDGPQLRLNDEQKERLVAAATARYEEIILRDLLPENRSKPHCRGLARSFCNWQRFLDFCVRWDVDLAEIRQQIKNALASRLAVMMVEGEDEAECSAVELFSFAQTLGVAMPGVFTPPAMHEHKA
ncbi:hypothetical protein JWG39_08885 [Desulforhopalus vacuolatus]|uniref:hypothetical protein n=1 Tax=Desulforhopalus vacuolatus TaxID=40414 RepID=UPI0019663E52|nr:hypothetical protein [Desulforhopalus vacuolatus]MBM9519931.1 hypothetical protein [Desulforhopalus vacuolatus]